MRLISVKILGENFRSLSANKLYSFNVTQRTDRLSTKVFAGLNGSGKSNFLELLAEIFFYLERYHLKLVTPTDKKGRNIGFEIEFILPIKTLRNSIGEVDFGETGCHVRIIKRLNDFPEFSYCTYGESDFIRRDHDTEALLPKRIIAYTSGQNEILSNPFFRIRYHYFKEIQENIKGQKESNYDRLFFLDASSNFSVFIANLLLAPVEKLKYIKQFFKIDGLYSFRITINFVDYKKKPIDFNENLRSYIERLKHCSTTWIQRRKGKENILIFDFTVNDATRDSFRFHFNSSFELFNAFYELDSLNLHLVAKDTRSLILKAHKSLNLSDELPKPDPSRLIFRIEKIILNKSVEEGKPAKKIYYKGLSDGEHQFNEIVGSVMMMDMDGCLFLMDEPDTHFNPLWRGQLVKMLNYVSAVEYETREKDKVDLQGNIVLIKKGQPEKEKYFFPKKVRRQEIIITTHSPFVISDSYKEDVYKFDRIGENVVYVNPQIETYGASLSLLLQEIFDRKTSISDLSNYDIDLLRYTLKKLKPQQLKAAIHDTKSKLLQFGESLEKFDMYSLLRELEDQTDKAK